MCACVCVRVLGVKARALTRAVPRTGRLSRGHPSRQLQALVGNRRTGLSRSSAPSGSAAAADAAGGGAGVPSSVPSRGTCLPRRRSASCRKPVRLCVSVPVSRVAVLVGVCTVPGHRSAEGVPSPSGCCLPTAPSAPGGGWHPWICRGLLRLHVPRWCVPRSLRPTCVPVPAWTSPVLCCVPSAAPCSVTTHVAAETAR